MKKALVRKIRRRLEEPPGIPLKGKEKQAFRASVQQLDEQCERLGLLDATDVEPAILFSVLEGEK